MITIFQGRKLSLDGTEDEVYATVAVALRDHLWCFHNGKNLNPFGVFLKIALHADAHGWAWPGRANISKGTGISTSQALSSALAHLRTMTIEGHRVLAMYRESDPESGQWGRTCYRIFPDAFTDGLSSAPAHLSGLVEYHGKKTKIASPSPMYDYHTLAPQPQEPIPDDPTLGDPTLGEPILDDQPDKYIHSEEKPEGRKPSFEEMAAEGQDGLSAFFGDRPTNGQAGKRVERLDAESLRAAAFGLTATAEGARIATGSEDGATSTEAAQFPWFDGWLEAIRHTRNQLSMDTYNRWLVRFALWEPDIIIPQSNKSTIRGWAKAIFDCLTPFFEAANAAGHPLDELTVCRLGVVGLDLFYTQREAGQYSFDVTSPFSLVKSMRKIAGEVLALQKAQGLDVTQMPRVDAGDIDPGLLEEGAAMSASLAALAVEM